MITVKIRKLCGCCYEYFSFDDINNLEEQMELAHKHITDDTGKTSFVDCYYGYEVID